MDSKKTQISSDQMSQLMTANNLQYTVPPSVSLFNSRQYVKYHAQNNVYTENSTVIINLSNSDTFVNPKTSYLKFKVRRVGGANVTFGEWGSAQNLWGGRCRFVHSSGVELSHDIDGAAYEALNKRVTEPIEWWTSEGKLEGHDTTVDNGEDKTFCIRIDRICKLFRSQKLLPPFLMSGSRLELNLSPASEAYFHDADVYTPFQVSDVQLVCDSYILSDSAFSTLEEMSAQGNVEYVCEGYELISTTRSVDQVNMELAKSLGRATRVLVGAYDAKTVGSREHSYCQPLGHNLSFSQSQFRINSLYLPSLPADVTENYITVLQSAKDKAVDKYPHKLAYVDYIGPMIDTNVDDETGMVIAQTLQRNSFLGPSSGLPINSSSSLRFEATFHGAVETRTTKMFCDHVKIITPYLYDRVVISV